MSDEEEDYGFTYSDEDEGDGDGVAEDPVYTSAENIYYTAKKAKADGSLGEACDSMKRMFALDPDNASTKVGDLKVKAMKQLAKMNIARRSFEEALTHYNALLGRISANALTRNYAEKSINAVLNAVAAVPQAEAGDQVAAFYAATLHLLSASAGNERLILNTRLKQARLLLSLGRLQELRELLATLAAGIQGSGGSGTDHSTALLEVYCLQLQLFTQLGDAKHVSELVLRAHSVAKSAVALPAVYGVMHESAGRVAMMGKRWEEARVEFLEAFKSFEGTPRATANFNLFLLANMLGSSRIDPFQDESVRSYRNVPAVEQMVRLMESYLPSLSGDTNGLRDCVVIISRYKRSKDSDPFIMGFLSTLLFNIQGNVAVDLLAPYSQVSIGFVAKELDLTVPEAETLLVDLLMDGRLPADAALNQVTGVLSLCGAHCAAPSQRYTKVSERVPGRNAALGSYGDRYGALSTLAARVAGMVDAARDALSRALSYAKESGVARVYGEEGGAESWGGRKGGGHHPHHRFGRAGR